MGDCEARMRSHTSMTGSDESFGDLCFKCTFSVLLIDLTGVQKSFQLWQAEQLESLLWCGEKKVSFCLPRVSREFVYPCIICDQCFLVATHYSFVFSHWVTRVLLPSGHTPHGDGLKWNAFPVKNDLIPVWRTLPLGLSVAYFPQSLLCLSHSGQLTWST